MKKVAMFAALALCAALAVPAAAGATAIDVTSELDNKDNDGLCTLREAVDAANSNLAVNPAGGDDCPAGSNVAEDSINLEQDETYTLSGPAGDDNNLSGDLDITAGGQTVNIVGIFDSNDVPTTTIEGGGDRIFDIRPSATSVGFFAQGLQLIHGVVTGGEGGGAIRVADPDAHFGLSTSRVQQNDAGGSGGAIFFPNAVDGYVFDVSQVQFFQNNADDEGGAIWIDAPQDDNATVERSSFIANTAGTMGGAAYVESSGATGDEPVLQFIESTLTFNSAHDGGGAVAFDFGLGGTVYFRFATLAYNSTETLGGGGGVFTNSTDQFVLFQGGTIVAGNAAGGVLSNCAGPGDFQSLGFNLDSQNTCGLDQGTDLRNVNPRLGMSAINPPGKQTTETMALFTGSPALDRIPSGSCDLPEFDQRLINRPVGLTSMCDVGAFEGSEAPDDAESDGVNDDVDNCPLDQNANQSNNDADFQGDVCDPDDDNDALLDNADNCPTQAVPANGGCPVPATTTPPATTGTPPATATKKCKKKKKKRHAEAAKKKKCKKKKRR